MKKVDKLPIGPEWRCSIIDITGDQLDEDGNAMTEHLELWHRDPVECVKGLIGNPAFKEFISYVPERVFMDDEGQVRVFDEMWTGNWWWDTQVHVSKIKNRKYLLFYLVEATKRCYHRATYSIIR